MIPLNPHECKSVLLEAFDVGPGWCLVAMLRHFARRPKGPISVIATPEEAAAESALSHDGSERQRKRPNQQHDSCHGLIPALACRVAFNTGFGAGLSNYTRGARHSRKISPALTGRGQPHSAQRQL